MTDERSRRGTAGAWSPGARSAARAAGAWFLVTLLGGAAAGAALGPEDRDPFFDGPSVDAAVFGVAVQSHGKILIAGGFELVDGVSSPHVARLNPDGSLDPSFAIGTGANASVEAVAVQPDGKILIGGNFGSVQGVSRPRIARLNADGSLDTGFSTGDGPGGTVRAIALQPDGRILIGGDFTGVDGSTRNRIARLNADGSLDTTFSTGTGANDTVWDIVVQPDGRILIGGEFTVVRANTRNRIARLEADSSVDQSFSTGTGVDDDVLAVALQSDGKVLIGGRFDEVRGNARPRIARLNADSSVDQSFSTGSGPSNNVTGIGLQPDGKILIAGLFNSVDGNSRNFVARLDVDGSVDPAFGLAHPAPPVIQPGALLVQPDGKVVLGGNMEDGVVRLLAGFSALDFFPG